jgi:iron complex outermembrane recepter protein
MADFVRQSTKIMCRGTWGVAAAVAVALMAGAAQAQPTTPDTDGAAARDGVDEVIVTARRREERLLDVPVSVSSFSGDRLEAVGAADLSYLKQVAPNVTLEHSRSTNSTLTAFIRGVGQQDPVAGFEQGVGLYVDDVYLNRPQGALLDIYDVERIEILRGPQGTLYGRNTIGGAVKYVTRRLGPDPEASARVIFGSYSRLDAIGTFGLPVTDELRVGGAVARYTRDGFGRNLFRPGVENYNKDVLAGRASVEWTPIPDLFFRLAGDWTEDTSDARMGHRLVDGQFGGAPVLRNVFNTRANLDVPQKPKFVNRGLALEAEWEVNERIMLRNTLAYRDGESDQQIDFDSLPVSDMEAPFRTEDDQFSQELQLHYAGDQFNGVFGFYYLRANAYNAFDVVLGQTGDLIGLPGLNAFTLGDVDTDTWSIFGDVTFDLADMFGWGGSNIDGLELAVGGRYTRDKREARVLRQTMIGGFSEFFGGTAIPIATTSDFEGSQTFTDFSPRISLSWRPNRDHMLYASFAEGFKGGGFDPRGATTAAPPGVSVDDFMRFEPEDIQTYEIGWKASLLNGRATVSLAGFYSDYENVQIPGSIGVDTTGDGITDTFAGVTTNAGESRFVGFEFEGNGILASNLFTTGDQYSLTWAVGYIDGEFREFIQAVTDPDTGETNLIDVSDDRNIQNTPKWTAHASLNFSWPLTLFNADGNLSLINSVSYRSATSQFEVSSPIDQPAYTLYDASLLWRSSDLRWELAVHGKNLTDKRYKVSGYDFLNIPNPIGLEGNLTAFYGDPRTVAASVGYRF